MKLLIFIYSMKSGGAERVTANLANHWAEKGWEITIVSLVSTGLDFYQLHPSIKRISFEMDDESSNMLVGLWQNLLRVGALRRTLYQVQPDIAVGMMTTANILLALASLGFSNLRTVGAEHIHPPQVPLGNMWETIRKKTYGLLDAVTALATEGEGWLKKNTTAKKVLVIPNAVTWPLLAQEPYITPSHVYPSQRQLLLAVGRMNPQKGFDWLIESFSHLADKHPNWDLVILGEGAIRETLENQVKALNLVDRILMPGRAGNINEWYRVADLFVMSSRYEGFPMVLVEAMAHGLPAVSFDCDTGPRDIIRHGVDGLLASAGNVKELTAVLDQLMSNDLLRREFASRAVEVKEKYSMQRICNMWEQLFEELMREI